MLNILTNLFFKKAYAACPNNPGETEICGDALPNTTRPDGWFNEGAVTTSLSILFAIIGALALITIVIAGLRYIAAAGDPQKTASAKSTIIYALAGLALAVFAEALVAFVARRIGF